MNDIRAEKAGNADIIEIKIVIMKLRCCLCHYILYFERIGLIYRKKQITNRLMSNRKFK